MKLYILVDSVIYFIGKITFGIRILQTLDRGVNYCFPEVKASYDIVSTRSGVLYGKGLR